MSTPTGSSSIRGRVAPARGAWEREYAEIHAYTTSYRDDLDRGVEFFLSYVASRGKRIEGPILECGCGRGRNVVPLAARGHTVVGLDHARTALVGLRDRVRREGLQARAAGLQHDLREPLPLTDGAAAAVLDITAVDNLTDPVDRRHYGLEVARVLRPGGLLVVVTFASDDGYYAPFLTSSPEPATGVVEDPNTGIKNQLFDAGLLDSVFCPPLRREAAGRLVFEDDAAEMAWTRRFLLHVYRRPADA